MLLFYVFFKKIHPSWHFLLFAVGIIAGGILTLVTRQVFVTTPLWLIFAVSALFLTFLWPTRAVLILSFLAGFLVINYRASFDLLGQDYFKNLVGETVTLSGTIAQDPETNDSGTTLKLKNLKVKSGEIPGTVYVKMSKNTTLERSDEVTLSGKIVGGFGTYAAALYRPTLKNITRPEPGDVFLKLRDNFAAKVREHLADDTATLGLGYLLGMRAGLPDELTDALKIVGLTHIVVASGAHLSILVGFARKLFGKLSRFAGLLGAVIFIFIFVGIVGFTPSMARASLVSLLSLATWYVGRSFKPLRLLILVAAATLVINPMYLIDLAWLLSFASFAGIMILGPKLTHFFHGDEKPGLIESLILETLAASLLCAPILIYFFGTVSLLALVTNLIIPPTLSAAMALTFLTGLFGFFFAPAAAMFGYLANLLLGFHLFVIDFFGARTEFLITLSAEDPRVFLLYVPLALPFFGKTLYNIHKCRKSLPRKN